MLDVADNGSMRATSIKAKAMAERSRFTSFIWLYSRMDWLYSRMEK
jgi:hypothetical protein